MHFRISVRRIAVTSTRHLSPLTKTVLAIWANDENMAKAGHVVATTPYGWILNLPEQNANPHWQADLPEDLAECVAWASKGPIEATHLEFDRREAPVPGLKIHDDRPLGLSPSSDATRTVRALMEEIASFRAQEGNLNRQASEISRILVSYIGSDQPLTPTAKRSLSLIETFMNSPLGQSSITPREILALAGQVTKNPVILGVAQTINQLVSKIHELDETGSSRPRTRRTRKRD